MSASRDRKTGPANKSAWAILLAGGDLPGFGPDIDPLFLSLKSQPILSYAISAVERCPEIEHVLIVASPPRVERIRAMIGMFGSSKCKAIIPAAGSRDAMVRAALQSLGESKPAFLAIVDGAMPFVTADMLSETVRLAKKYGAASAANEITGPIVRTDHGAKVTGWSNGSTWWRTSGPQAFRVEVLEKALEYAAKKKLQVPDEASAVVAMKQDLRILPVQQRLIRIETRPDLALAEFLMR
ncbi:MAG: 2-C-methyl-D-erythritol 4-phosphate cytidylyltransferase [Kiritimatiellae bacterium]|nr:2-C-methyl-D-erythritol 4-phosphate cytidylyltransferase [Kiritimatiellia bacterium]MDW8458412.1 2-C-methyl-D-erythritol 4-phosphate cytidylyltransferase [Verrucomicrobiota bacterium]